MGRPMTYMEEMRAKYPDRPYAARPTLELQNMARALSFCWWSNTTEEEQRLEDVNRELAIRRRQGRAA